MTTTREPREPSRREDRDSHGRRHHSSYRSRRDDPSPRRWRDDRRHESDRSQYRRRAEESANAGDRDERRNRPLQDAAQRNDPLPAEGKPLSDTKEDPPVRHEISPRGTKRFSETRESWRPRSSFFQHDERDSAGQRGRRVDRQGKYGRQRDQKEHLGDRDKHKSEGHGLQGKAEQVHQQSDVESTWKHDGFFQLEEEAPAAKRRPAFREMGMPLEEQGSASVTEPDSRSRKPDQPGLSGMGEERRSHHSREFVRPDDRGTRWGFSDYRSAGQRNGYDSRGRFAGRGGRGRDRFNNSYDGRNMYQAAGDQEEKWKHDLYDQTNSTPAPLTEEEQIAKVEALLSL
ncbi:peptidyl-prolyl cis-trans isomerase 8 isoform X2 [Brachypodium distachyon]|uniref:peptidyl-prolyl cis-trans isomerase 8 isoform X2 n=1 Tax=Brachypodium distachyon TaxID=15368 RepID=UPI00052FE9E2|nr:peptidyl-prolyl cis-trans isomerase 8 isoform X2 [Brachypodium distachyon]|eukprot:XP_010229013.1 peptidyl-prolyl cis-trans isomerase 8 isoform X2 [Brachypodium distachyon]